jgi:hypothetical protein
MEYQLRMFFVIKILLGLEVERNSSTMEKAHQESQMYTILFGKTSKVLMSIVEA